MAEATRPGQRPESAPPTAPAIRPRPSGGGEYVTVASKLPHGLVLQNEHKESRWESSPMGQREVDVYVREPETYVLKGNVINISKMRKGIMPDHQIIGGSYGYALTPNIPREFWERWLDAHKDMDCVKNGLIWAHSEDASLRRYARDNEENKSGLEPIDPEAPSARFKGADWDSRAPLPTRG